MKRRDESRETIEKIETIGDHVTLGGGGGGTDQHQSKFIEISKKTVENQTEIAGLR
jgi:hypothetical protein